MLAASRGWRWRVRRRRARARANARGRDRGGAHRRHPAVGAGRARRRGEPLLREGAGRHAGRRGQDRAGRRRRRGRAASRRPTPALRRGEVARAARLPEESAATWTLAGIDPGSTVIVPLAFEGQAAQFSHQGRGRARARAAARRQARRQGGAAAARAAVLGQAAGRRGDDARAEGGADAADGGARQPDRDAPPPRAPRCSTCSRATRASWAGRASRPRSWTRGWRSSSRRRCRTRSRTWAAQRRRCCWTSSRRWAPRRVYRDPKDPAGRAAFEVIRDAAPAAPAGARSSSSRRRGRRDAAGASAARRRSRRCSTPANDRQHGALRRHAGGRARAPRSRATPTRARRRSCTSCRAAGELTVGSEKIPFGAEEALHIPDGPAARARSSPARTRPIMVQIFAPAGPEERYRAPAGGKRTPK